MPALLQESRSGRRRPDATKCPLPRYRADLAREIFMGNLMNRNALYLLIGALVIAVGVLGFSLSQEKQKKSGIDISVGDRGISIETKK
jgi:hypothetical protein